MTELASLFSLAAEENPLGGVDIRVLLEQRVTPGPGLVPMVRDKRGANFFTLSCFVTGTSIVRFHQLDRSISYYLDQ